LTRWSTSPGRGADGTLGLIAIQLGDVVRQFVEPPLHACQLLAHAANVGPSRQVQQMQAAPGDAFGRTRHLAPDTRRRTDQIEVRVGADRGFDRLTDRPFDTENNSKPQGLICWHVEPAYVGDELTSS
jgi:hypothetical protein